MPLAALLDNKKGWKSEMKVLICTYGRANKQTTWNSLPQDIKEITTLVVQDKEKDLYRPYPTLVLPPNIQTIGPTRQWLVDHIFEKKVIMFDDDLVFATRREDQPTKFVPSTTSDIEAMLKEIVTFLNIYAAVGVAPREGANRVIEPYRYCTRMMRVLGFRFDVLREENIRFDRIPVMEDFDATLQLMRLGYENVLLNRWVNNQAGSDVSGGCSTYRTPEIQEQAAMGLAELHPGFVTVVTKKTKTSWGGKERKDVRVQWKQAFASAGKVSILD